MTERIVGYHRPKRHPAHQQHRDNRTFGQRVADGAVGGMGSWRFILAQSGVVACWVGLNMLALVRHWDPYPFILLNLLFSTQAAYAAPLILMASNRAAQRDEALAAAHYDETTKLDRLLTDNTELTRETHANTQAIRDLSTRIDAALSAPKPRPATRARPKAADASAHGPRSGKGASK